MTCTQAYPHSDSQAEDQVYDDDDEICRADTGVTKGARNVNLHIASPTTGGIEVVLVFKLITVWKCKIAANEDEDQGSTLKFV